MVEGWFVSPSGVRSKLIAGNVREFRALVSRKIRVGWTLAADSPRFPLEDAEELIALGVGPPVAAAEPGHFAAAAKFGAAAAALDGFAADLDDVIADAVRDREAAVADAVAETSDEVPEPGRKTRRHPRNG